MAPRSAVAALCGALLLNGAAAYQRPDRYLLATSPKTANVYWVQLPSFQDLTVPSEERPLPNAQVLIDGDASKCTGWSCDETSEQGLVTPQGLALRQIGGAAAQLYVSDPTVGNIYRYKVDISWRGMVRAGKQERIQKGLKGEARRLTMDSYGNLFYTISRSGKIKMISAKSLATAIPRSETLYEAKSFPAVAGPAGIVSDNYNLFWANSEGNAKTGNVVKASAAMQKTPEALTSSDGMYRALATDICIARDNVFFTGQTRSLFAVKADGGGKPFEITHHLTKPRGCAYDQESTLFVADENQIISLPANLGEPRKIKHLDKVAFIEDADQLVIFYGPSSTAALRNLAQEETNSVDQAEIASTVRSAATALRGGFMALSCALLAMFSQL
eukprot:TRINITY_DN96176_c0_g1_i1.p1 TRINITY_DN96176_c0_g1~~TRINITY_DN96176_c0_g1_i1.p1  ORF type:complete len:388 (+),score=80.11 TRINITY_DN96176_c0_g1_i1:139-1302(+)